jgi:hypothetical protein
MSAGKKNERQALRAMSEAFRIRPAWGSGSGLCWEATRRGIPKPSLTRWAVGFRANKQTFDPSPTAVTPEVPLAGLKASIAGCASFPKQNTPLPFPSGAYRRGDVMPQKIPGALGAEPPKTSRGRRSRFHSSEGRGGRSGPSSHREKCLGNHPSISKSSLKTGPIYRGNRSEMTGHFEFGFGIIGQKRLETAQNSDSATCWYQRVCVLTHRDGRV